MACFFGHKWQGCKCIKCGKTRDEGHDWQGCICATCGKRRDEAHKYLYRYKLEACQGECIRCKKKITMPHDFQPVPGKCYKECTRCHGKTSPTHQLRKAEDRCALVCTVCGAEIEKHDYVQVPGTNRMVCSVCGKEGKVKLTEVERKAIDTLTQNRVDSYEANKLREEAADKLAASCHVEAIKALEKAARSDPSWGVRVQAMTALGKIAAAGTQGVEIKTQLFTDALRDKDNHVVKCAAKIIGDLKLEEGIKPLISVLSRYRDGQDFSGAAAAIDALGEMGEMALPALLPRAQENSSVRPLILRALAKSALLEAFDVLREGVLDESLYPYNRVFIVAGLEKYGTPQAIEVLIEALDRATDEKLVKAISESLERMGADVSPELLEEKKKAAEIRSAKKLLEGFRALRPGLTEDEADELVGPGTFQMGDNVVHNTRFGNFQLLINHNTLYGTLSTETVIANIEAWLKENEDAN